VDRVVHYFKNVVDFDKKRTVQHFLEKKVPRTTISRILEKFLECGEVIYRKPKGRLVYKDTYLCTVYTAVVCSVRSMRFGFLCSVAYKPRRERTRDLSPDTFQTLTSHNFALSAPIWLKLKICAVT